LHLYGLIVNGRCIAQYTARDPKHVLLAFDLLNDAVHTISEKDLPCLWIADLGETPHNHVGDSAYDTEGKALWWRMVYVDGKPELTDAPLANTRELVFS